MERIPIRLRMVALAVLLALGAQPLAHALTGSRQYTVRPGDTLGAISNSVRVPVETIIELNHLPDADHIQAGQILTLPDQASPSAASGSSAPTRSNQEYTVRPGDSLSRLAAEFGISVSALLSANALSDANKIVAGQKLVIPSSQSSSSDQQTSASTAPRATHSSTGASDVGSLIEQVASQQRLDPATVKSLAWYLSGWRPNAGNPSGAYGVMQVTANAQEWVNASLLKRAADRSTPRDNVEIGVAYLAYLTSKFGDEKQAVAAYLQGPASLARNGVLPSTARALEAIYGARGRFAGGTQSVQTERVVAEPVNLSQAVLNAARLVSPTARIGVSARNLATGEQLDIKAGEVFPSASVNKLPIMAEVFRQISAGTLASSARVQDDLERMITLSDNEAANRLLDQVGESSVNATMGQLGLGSTALRNYFSLRRGPQDPGFNQTSPSDMATLLSLLANDRLVGSASSQQMRALLFRTQDNSKLLRGVPSGTRVAHKSGWYGGVANDAGIVYAPRAAYAVAVFTQGAASDETGNQLVAAISRAIYDAWGK